MSKTVKAKFNVSELTRYGNGGGGKVVMNAVTGNSDENKEFWNYTPSGTLTMHIDNEDAFKQFDGMGEFYIEITKS